MNKSWKTKSACLNDAQKFTNKTKWINQSSGAYNSALKNGWIDECCAHMIPLGSKYKRLIYAFEFPDNYVYVGLTFNPFERKKAHLNNQNSQVFKHIEKTNLKPKFVELSKYLGIELAAKRETYYLGEYKKKGWNILNKAKTGGLGGKLRKWTLEKCKDDALQYSTRSKWQKNSNGAYKAATKENWLDICCSHMPLIKRPNGFWTIKKCSIEAKKYQTRNEFKKKSTGAYKAAFRNKWLDICCKHMKPFSLHM